MAATKITVRNDGSYGLKATSRFLTRTAGLSALADAHRLGCADAAIPNRSPSATEHIRRSISTVRFRPGTFLHPYLRVRLVVCIAGSNW